MHEDPQILYYGRSNTDMELKGGMVFTIEPILNQGRTAIRSYPDQWPVYTRDVRTYRRHDEHRRAGTDPSAGRKTAVPNWMMSCARLRAPRRRLGAAGDDGMRLVA
jgi:methionyl aminopeptidase